MACSAIDYWIRNLEQDPSALALIDSSGESVRREELESESERLARRLLALGLRKRESIVLCLPNGLGWMASFLACLKLEVVVIFADHGMSEEDLKRLCQTTRARGVWNGDSLDRGLGYVPKRFRDSRIILGKLTSGSTGLPRCHYFKDSEMVADGELTARAFGYRRGDRILGMIPWGHSYGLGAIVMPFLIHGLEVISLRSPLPRDIVTACEKWRPSVFPSVPTVISALVRSDCPADSFMDLRALITAGSRLDPELAQAMEAKYGIVPRSLYGSSETGSIAVDPDGELTKRGESVGKTIAGVVAQTGRDGRLRISSPMVYTHGNRSIDEKGRGVCCVGDFGYVRLNGELVLQARAKGFVKVGEKRIGLADVERRLKEIEGIRCVLALSLETEAGPVLAAALESERSRQELAQAIRTHLPAKHRPRVWLVLSELPVTGRGKVSDSAIRALLREQRLSSASR